MSTNPIIPSKPFDNSHGVTSYKTRPVGEPTSKKDFKRMVNEPPTKEEQEYAGIEESEEEQPATLPSPFDLSPKKPRLKQTSSASTPFSALKEGYLVDERPQEYENSLIDGDSDESGLAVNQDIVPEGTEDLLDNELVPNKPLPLPEKTTMDAGQQQALAMAKKDNPRALSMETDATVPSSKKETTKSSNKSESTSFNEEKIDLAAVNPQIQALKFSIDAAEIEEQPILKQSMQSLATQMIEKIQIMRDKDQTQTTVTLKHPPIFEGATVTLIANDSAKREFSISFANLSTNAKALLDQKLSEHSLTATLERQGIAVTQLSTSILPQATMTAETGSQESGRDRRQFNDQQKRQGSQQSKDEGQHA